jgi:hypothetical protein
VGGAFVRSAEKISPRIALGWASVGKQLRTQAGLAPGGLGEPCALSVLYTLPRLHPTVLAISVAPIPSLRRATMRAIEGDRAAVVNAFRFCGVDAGALPITDKAELHLCDYTQHDQDHAAHRIAGIDRRLQNPEACAFLFQFVHEVKNVPRFSA